MSFDNRLFNINGKSEEALLRTLELAFMIHGNHTVAESWVMDKEKGLILLWYYRDDDSPRSNPFPAPLTATEVLPAVLAYLKSKEAGLIQLERWEQDIDQDGENGPGWRVYLEDWGHVGNISCAICAIKRVFLWYGK